MFVARDKSPHAKVARNTEKVEQLYPTVLINYQLFGQCLSTTTAEEKTVKLPI